MKKKYDEQIFLRYGRYPTQSRWGKISVIVFVGWSLGLDRTELLDIIRTVADLDDAINLDVGGTCLTSPGCGGPGWRGRFGGRWDQAWHHRDVGEP